MKACSRKRSCILLSLSEIISRVPRVPLHCNHCLSELDDVVVNCGGRHCSIEHETTLYFASRQSFIY